jgi:low affinity Fe/Cu permease
MSKNQSNGRAKEPPSLGDRFARFARSISGLFSKPTTFVLAVFFVAAWAFSGPLFGFSEQWQLVINTATTIVTFLMVFVIQNTQNRDSTAMHLKLDELLRAMNGARNQMIDLERVPESELQKYVDEFAAIHRRYEKALNRKRSKETPAALKN